MNSFQCAVIGPQIEVVVDRAFRRQVFRDRAPLTAGRENVHEAVHPADQWRTAQSRLFPTDPWRGVIFFGREVRGRDRALPTRLHPGTGAVGATGITAAGCAAGTARAEVARDCRLSATSERMSCSGSIAAICDEGEASVKRRSGLASGKSSIWAWSFPPRHRHDADRCAGWSVQGSCSGR